MTRTCISLELVASNLMFLILHGLKPWQIDFSPFLPTYSWDLTTSPLHFFSPLPAVTHSQTLGQAISVVLVDCCCIHPMLHACQPCPLCPTFVVHCVVSVHSIFRPFLFKPFALDSPMLVLPLTILSSHRTCKFTLPILFSSFSPLIPTHPLCLVRTSTPHSFILFRSNHFYYTLL